jgi:spore coat protein A
VGVPFVLGAGQPTSTGDLLRSRRPLPAPFRAPLTLPPVLRPTRSDSTTDYFEIVQAAAMASILPGVQTKIWGYNGIFPGPTVRTRRDRTAVVRHTNQLAVPTVVHLHGGHTPHDSDGYPTDFIYPRSMPSAGMDMNMGGISRMAGDTTVGSRTYRYPLDQRAATLWYHDHRMDFTGPSVWRGLAGFHLHVDDEEEALKLPSGSRELPLMITDRSFDSDGSWLYPAVDPTGMHTAGVTGDFVAGVLGDVMLVNGSPWPVAHVSGAHYRLRILNACNARRLDLRLDPAPAGGHMQIGTDGGLLQSPMQHTHIELAPAQRFDAVIDFSGYSPGTVVTLRNDFGAGRMADVMRFIVGDAVDDDFSMPSRLSTIVPLLASDATVTRTMQFQSGRVGGVDGWKINGVPFGINSVAATVALDSVEVWRLTADLHHPVHIHMNPFQVLSRDQRSPGEFDAGWKDTVDLRPGEEVEIAIRFEGYPGKYVFHCHNLEHEDMGMMANFVAR